MRLKSYFADTIEAAMALATRELGEDALIVYSREASAEAKYLGSYEVVFAVEETAAPVSPARHDNLLVGAAKGLAIAPAPALVASRAAVEVEQLAFAASALSELKSEIGFLRQDVASHRRCLEDLLAASDRRAWRLLADWGSEPELVPGVALAGRLLQADMDPEHVLEVIESARDGVRGQGLPEGPGNQGRLWNSQLERELIDRRAINSALPTPGEGAAVVLIGPPGAGKTTVAMQLAALAAGRGSDPRLIAFEPGRLTAAQTLRSYGAVLGIPFELTRRADHVAGLLATRLRPSITIIDGPGVGPVSDDGAAQLRSLCGQVSRLETWLVLPATMRAYDLRLLAVRFAEFAPSRLVFTHTGETHHWGAVWSAAEWVNAPISFFCDGPRVPEDLRPASGESLAGNLLEEPPNPAAAGTAARGKRGAWQTAGREAAGGRD